MNSFWNRRARKSPRLQGYDYSQEGAYFVTICTHRRAHLFGEIVDGEMRLSAMGSMAESCWVEIPAHFPHVELDAYVIMPNHVHGILAIMDAPTSPQSPDPVRRDEACLVLDKPENLTLSPRPKGVKPGSLGAVVGSYKSAVTRRIHRQMDDPVVKIWQGRYHDHIIRDEISLNKLREYILYNPAGWEDDTFYSV